MAGHETANGYVKRIVDLRSDTVTKPTPEMRQAMANALVDDDVLGVDPTVDQLQKEMAQICGKDAGLFVASGTMGNLISVLVHCEVRGSEVIIGSESHIHHYEQGGISTLGHVYSNIVPNESDGTLDLRKVEDAIRPDDVHYPTTRLICIENTHGSLGGRCIGSEYTDKLGGLARRYGLKLHIDGARIFNAATALNVPIQRLVEAADSVSVCLSKGLGAPVGSVIVGSFEFIAKARRLRKALGGGMRQLGVLAAPALVSIHDIAGKLHIDHQNAHRLAEGLTRIKGIHVDLASVETNMVFVEVTEDSPLSANEICKSLKNYGILTMALTKNKVRAVFHHQISEDDVQHAIRCFQVALENHTGCTM
ncbi:hypothetical protein KP509_01G101900 [Ceratopteris richardii]|uniref:Aromatic amino acid beta-eliminating lyase/threonine aldolase domain-containing protein n=2 Tax=Ceratopteris richardii TaxID=49495 RepID=A0A8T2VJC2_CERRI|nr:hypothetical protein KP509_01G101900 [Ceratopteris richardii]KAH7447340.1 hypothetical protein KP509_01G101900 [Ceratopteris richardii]